MDKDQKRYAMDLPKLTWQPNGVLLAVYLIPQHKTRAGLVLPENMSGEKPEANRFIVLGAGPDCKMGFKAGDEVLSVYPATAITHNGITTGWIKEDQIIGKVLPEFRTEVENASPAHL